MALKTKLTGALQENVLTLLAFDTKAIPSLLAAIEPELFESAIYRDIADKAITYYRKYKKAPAEHLPDLLEDKLTGKGAESKMYSDLLNDLYSLKDDVNRKYVLDSLQSFVRQQSIRIGIIQAAEELNSGNIDAAERLILDGVNRRIEIFDRGVSLREAATDSSLYDPQQDLIRTGIESLDRAGVCPAPGELFTILAPPNRGKSWALMSFGKFAALQRKKVLHITLEMSEKKVSRRYIQSFFGMTARPKHFEVQTFRKDKKGRFSSLKSRIEKRRPALTDPKTRTRIKNRMSRFGAKFDRILVKQFPTGSLTTDGLYAYLEMLELEEGFIPDVLIIDYADLMKIDSANLRIDTGRVYKDLRGVAVNKNIAVITASQTNRKAEESRIITMANLAEDYSKAAISDNIVSYNATKNEREKGVARLFIAKARDEQALLMIMITQSYASGQFCLDSLPMYDESRYWLAIDGGIDDDS